MSYCTEMRMMSKNRELPNQRTGADAGWWVLFALERLWARAAQAERWATAHHDT